MQKKLVECVGVFAIMLFLAAPLCAKPWGIVATFPDYSDNATDNASIHTIDLGQDPPVVYGPFLSGELSDNASAAPLDVTMIPGNWKALISTFENQKVHVVDLQDPTNPVLEASISLPFPAEDIAISGDRKRALVTDGGLSSMVSIIDLKTLTATNFDLGEGRFAQAVAVSKKNVAIFADYQGGAVHYGKINKTLDGLESIRTIALCDNGTEDNATACNDTPALPVNVTISPDGKTVLVATSFSGRALYVFELTKKGDLIPGSPFRFDGLPGEPQSIAFNGKKMAYVLINETSGMGDPSGVAAEASPDLLCEIAIRKRGMVDYGKGCYQLVNTTYGGYFGVDAVDIAKKKILVGNPTSLIDNPDSNYVTSIDLKTGDVTPIELNNNGIAAGVAIKP